MANMSLEIQRQKMLEMRSYLGEFCVKLNSGMDNLREKLHQNVAMGFPIEIAATYEQAYYATEKQDIDRLVQAIQTTHFDYIDGVVADIQAAIDLT